MRILKHSIETQNTRTQSMHVLLFIKVLRERFNNSALIIGITLEYLLIRYQF